LTISFPCTLAGIAYSKHLVHLYNYNGRDDLVQHLEVILTNKLCFPGVNYLLLFLVSVVF